MLSKVRSELISKYNVMSPDVFRSGRQQRFQAAQQTVEGFEARAAPLSTWTVALHLALRVPQFGPD